MRRRTLLAQILAVVAVGCGKSPAPDPTTPTPTSSSGGETDACPDRTGTFAKWPKDERPGFETGLNEVCLPKPANGKCAVYSNACILKRFQCGLHNGGEKVEGTLPADEGHCCWKVRGQCAIGRPFIVDGVARTAEIKARESDWAQPPGLDAAGLPLDVRGALADVWAQDGVGHRNRRGGRSATRGRRLRRRRLTRRFRPVPSRGCR
jgi:hypothetical protein